MCIFYKSLWFSTGAQKLIRIGKSVFSCEIFGENFKMKHPLNVQWNLKTYAP